MTEANTNSIEGSASPAKRKRASRKGQPRRFECSQEGCDKKYSRAEHLARHELNHSPKHVYRCEANSCGHTFVRFDLFARHKKKHEDAVERAISTENFAPEAQRHVLAEANTQVSSIPSQPPACFSTAETSYIRTGASRSDKESQWQLGGNTPLLPTQGESVVDAVQPTDRQGTTFNNGLDNDYPALGTTWLSDQAASGADVYMSTAQSNENFAAWLFDTPGTQQSDFDLTNLPCVDFGMDYPSNELWSFNPLPVPPGATGGTAHDHFLSFGYGQMPMGESRLADHTRISEIRREQILAIISSFWSKKRPTNIEACAPADSIMITSDGRNWPNLTTTALETCLTAYWRDVAKKMPIVHQPTFSCDTSNTLVLLAMVALGASQLVRLSTKGSLRDYKDFADLIAINLRWEIFTDDDAQPPVQLWVAQALLLLELYEKMYTTRRLHERAHIHHASTITLLRRGSPLTGRAGSESPQSGMRTRNMTPVGSIHATRRPRETDVMRWWCHWAQNESMHRVVFAAFQMDAFHAVMFGHESSLSPYEIRLPLPCDDTLWAAKNPEEVQRLDATFSMHGIKPIKFLDGLKRCLHGQEVQSHHNARLLLVAGLFSVGWHINRREKHLQFLETVPSPNEQERWKSTLLGAYGHWRRSFEDALNNLKARQTGTRRAADETAYPTVLYHLAHITTYVDIIDLQVFAGYKRLLGRKVTQQDHANVVHRMKAWVGTRTARLAVLHAFRLLHDTLSCHGHSCSHTSTDAMTRYSARADHLIYRPWALYLAALTIWAHHCGSRPELFSNQRQRATYHVEDDKKIASQYICHCAATENQDNPFLLAPNQGCAAMLRTLSSKLADAESELLVEASERLDECAKVLMGPST